MAGVHAKIIIAYEEYERLHTIAEKYEQLLKKQEHQVEQGKKISRSLELFITIKRKIHKYPLSDSVKEDVIQSGSGFSEESVIEKITNKVVQKLSDNINFRPSLQAPTIQTITSNVVDNIPAPGPSFGVTIKKGDLNDDFDIKHLISLVPRAYRDKAKKLLSVFENRPDDITFSAQGTIFINGESIPGSNMFLVFPALFKRGKKFTGFKELVQKIKEMELDHLVSETNRKITTGLIGLKNKKQLTVSKSVSSNWWVLK